jgi:hypothetical protein
VLRYLKVEKIRVVAEDLNDIYPRKVYFFPRTGKVLVKKLMQMHNDTLVKRESLRQQAGHQAGGRRGGPVLTAMIVSREEIRVIE